MFGDVASAGSVRAVLSARESAHSWTVKGNPNLIRVAKFKRKGGSLGCGAKPASGNGNLSTRRCPAQGKFR